MVKTAAQWGSVQLLVQDIPGGPLAGERLVRSPFVCSVRVPLVDAWVLSAQSSSGAIHPAAVRAQTRQCRPASQGPRVQEHLGEQRAAVVDEARAATVLSVIVRV